ncbi:hypothetical protein TSAR_004902 [Trichomalopsis sarcophagae]|uniref:Uncharacterized protein n=1 Tax=Trichomalopsis sarcophagae TaxID=543379 RepID=A0A232FF96_9HYME|nr:hypothetical protein TSAR_004902 [Trichomalopsis sarcophagae]
MGSGYCVSYRCRYYAIIIMLDYAVNNEFQMRLEIDHCCCYYNNDAYKKSTKSIATEIKIYTLERKRESRGPSYFEGLAVATES